MFYTTPQALIPDPRAFAADALTMITGKSTAASLVAAPMRDVTFLRDGNFTHLQTMDVAPVAADPLKVCMPWLLSYVSYSGLIVFAAFILVATNYGIEVFLDSSISFDRYASHEEERLAFLARAVLVQVFNTAVLT